MTTQTPPPPPAPPPAPTVVRAADAAEFLSMVPHLAGCTPRDSLVLVPFADRRTMGALRVDLPPADVDPARLPELAAAFVAMLTRIQHANRVAIVVYTDDPYRDAHGRIARSALVEALLRCAHAADYAIVEALCVAADAWGSHLEPDGPWAGHPLDRIRPEDVDWPGSDRDAIRADQTAGCELPPSDLVERERVARELTSMSVRLDDPAIPALLEDAVAHDDEPSPRGLALLTLMLDRPAIRDIALSQWCGGVEAGRAIQRFNVAWAAGEDVDLDGPLALAGEGPTPDADRLRRALALTKRVAACAPRERRAGPLAAAAWLSWALGRSTHAANFVGLAQAIDPGHGLAGIVARMVAAGHLPAWAYERPVPGPPPRNRAERRRRERSQRRAGSAT